MTTLTPPRRGRPPTPGGAPTGAERTAASRARRRVAAVELDPATMALVDQIMARCRFSSRVEVVRLTIQTAHDRWLTHRPR